MNRIMRFFLSVVLLSAGLIVVNPTRADAASNCINSGFLACYYKGANYSSTRGVIPDGSFSGPCYFNVLAFSTSSSLFNNTSHTHTWYTGVNYNGSAVTVGGLSGRATLSSTFNDNIRSWKGTCYGGTR